MADILFFSGLGLMFFGMIIQFFSQVWEKEKGRKIAWIIFTAGFALQGCYILMRGIEAGRVPMANQFEFAMMFSFGIGVILMILHYVLKIEWITTPGMIMAWGIYLYAALLPREIHELMPALQSSWLGFHVFTAIIAYGSFGVAFGVAMVFLFQKPLQNSKFARNYFPDQDTLDLITYRAVSLGFLFLTLCMITGAIWAKRAWGSYWSWDPKETWSLITWIIYAIYLHLRLNKGWKGRKAAIFAAIGFICVIFTYVGVNTLLAGLHSYK